jgi:RNA polymerase-binding protein DksA
VSPKPSKKKPSSPARPARKASKPSRPAARVPARPAPRAAGRREAVLAAPAKAAPKPKSPYGKKELATFRDALLALRSHRIGDKESREQEALKAAGQDVSVDHMADFGTDNYEQEFTLGILEQDVETLRDIHDALARIDEGTFGLCEECLEPVAKARLRALPYARLCVECKSKEE